MAKFKFTDNQREVAKKSAFRNYQRDLLDAYLFGATDEEKTDIIGKFNADTKDGAYLIINGTDSKVNENGQLITTDKDGNIETDQLDHLLPWSDNLPAHCHKPRRD